MTKRSSEAAAALTAGAMAVVGWGTLGAVAAASGVVAFLVDHPRAGAVGAVLLATAAFAGWRAWARAKALRRLSDAAGDDASAA